MYLLGPHRVYFVHVVAGCAWVPEERIWACEVFVVGEGIPFIVEDSVRLMAQLNHAHIIAAELWLRTYEHELTQHRGPHTTTNTEGHGDVGETREWQGTDVGGDRTTSDPATEGHGSPMADAAPSGLGDWD